MAIIRNYGFTALTGEGAGALDRLPLTGGPTLVDGDMAYGIVSDKFHAYKYSSASTAAEASPYIISPSDAVGRWELIHMDYEVDALLCYGESTNYTQATIEAALTAIGTATDATLLLRPGTWAITANLTIPSNVTLKLPAGLLLQVATGKTLTINGPMEAGLYQVFDCDGSVIFGNLNLQAHAIWFYSSAWHTAINQAISSLPYGGIVQLLSGYLTVSDTIVLKDGITLRGLGKSPISGLPTYLDFSAIDASKACISGDALSDSKIEDLYIAGKTVDGSAPDINIIGYSRRVSINHIIVNSGMTAESCVYFYALIESEVNDLTTVGGKYGLNIDTACTSIRVSNCYASGATEGGYLIQGTYIGLYSCASDENNIYGYILQNAKGVSLISCGAESNTRSAFRVLDAEGITTISFRSHNNNTGASVTYPSFMDISNSDNIVNINPIDTDPDAATNHSITSVSLDAGTSILNINPALDCAIHANCDAIRIEDKKLYIGGSQVLSTRNTGWTTMAGTAVKNNGGINADTITSSDANMQAMAKALKGVVDALISHGLIGA